MEIDREGVELAALREAANFASTRVLEIGCGDGRLASRYAPLTRLTVGIDSAADKIGLASMSAARRGRLRVVRASIPLPFLDSTFDITLLGWSL